MEHAEPTNAPEGACIVGDNYCVVRHDEQRILTIPNGRAEKFTKTEYVLVSNLLSGTVVPNTQLLKALSKESEGDRALQKALEKHIENIRSKLRPLRLAIHRVHQYGYILLPNVEGE